MGEPFSDNAPDQSPPWLEPSETEVTPPESTITLSTDEIAVSQPFVGRWNKLVSTTNWEKGQIINEWRSQLLEHNVELEERTDEAWSRLVGDVSPQHVGRLRRVFSRFGTTHDEYDGLYWSHFLAALDWDDAEMWLEGALREKWSIKQMIGQRFETITSTRMASGDVTHDTISREEEATETKREPRERTKYDDEYSSDEDASGPRHEGPDFGEEPSKSKSAPSPVMGGEWADVSGGGTPPEGPPLYWQEVPTDLAESMEALKLAIIKHKLSEWADVSPDAVLTNLEILRRIALAR
jgi:hypothetical protein